MSSQKFGLSIVLVCCLIIAYVAGHHNAIPEGAPPSPITITPPPDTIAPQSLAPSDAPKRQVTCDVIGNKNSGIYHVPGCASYHRVRGYNREYFCSEEEAEKAGYRKARNCR